MRINSTTLFLIFTVLLLTFSCKDKLTKGVTIRTEYGRQKDTLTTEEASADFNTLISALKTIHPALYKYTPEAELNGYFDSLRASIKTRISVISLYNLARLAVSRIKCSHTFIKFNSQIQTALQNDYNMLFLNFGVFYNAGHFYLNTEDTPAKFSELISINGHTVPELYADLSKYTTVDGGENCIDSFQLGEDFYYKYYLNYDLKKFAATHKYDESPAQITYKRNNHIETAIIKKRPFGFAYYSNPQNPLNLYTWDEDYDLAINDSEGYAVLTVKTFAFSKERSKAFKHYVENSFNLLSFKKNIKNLVIDIRNNAGGDIDLMDYFSSFTLGCTFKRCLSAKTKVRNFKSLPFETQVYDGANDYVDSILMQDYDSINRNEFALKQLKIPVYQQAKNSFNGKIIILTNHGTGSAATYFASLHQDRKRAVIVGEDPNGDYSGLSCFYQLSVTLPNSRLEVVIPVADVKFDLINQQPKNTRGLVPDFIVSQKLDEALKGKDTQLNFAITLTE